MRRKGDSRRVREGSRALGTGAAAIALAVLAAGCAIEPPSAPSTDFVISIPIANDSTRVADIVGERSDFLQLNEQTGGMNIRFSREVGRAEVGDRLRISPTANSFTTQIGDIEIPGQEIPPISLSMDALLGQDIPEGTLPLVPASTIDTQVEFPLEGVTSLVIKEGGIDIAVLNGLPVPLNSLRMTLVDIGRGGVTIDQIDLGNVAANGGTASGVFVLDGKDISANLAISVSGNTPESSNVTVEGSPSLDISVILRDMLVTEATAVIPQQTFSDRQVLTFPDDRILVTRAVIQEGGLTFRVQNQIALVMEVVIRLDDLHRPDGTVNEFRIDQLTPGEVRELRFDLIENEFTPIDPLEMRFSYDVRTFPSDGSIPLISTGEIFVEAITEELSFALVQGRLNRVRLPLPEVEREVDFPEGLNNVSLAGAAMDIHVTSGVAFVADVSLNVTGTNRFGETGRLEIEERFPRSSADNPVTTVVTVTRGELTPFLNLLPSHLIIEPEVRIGDGQSEERIRPAHWVSIDSVVFRTSPRLTVEDTTRIDPEVRNITFRDSEVRRKIRTNFKSARIITDLENSIPLGVGVRLFVGRTPQGVYDVNSPDHVITIPRRDLGQPPFQSVAAPVDANGYSVGTETVQREIEITSEEVVKFILEDDDPGELYSGVRVTFPKTPGEVEVRGTDFINILAALKIELLLDENLVK